MRKRKINFPVKPLIIVSVVFSALLLSAAALFSAGKNSGYFKVREIIVSDKHAADFSYLKGENIFALDLENESRYILEHYPGYRNIRLVRVLPDRLYVQFVERRPAAEVKLYRNFYVDRYGVLFYPADPVSGLDLPVITGLETKIFGPKPGKRYEVKELQYALEVINLFRFNRTLRSYKLKKLDVRDLKDVSLFLSVPVEVQPGDFRKSNWIQVRLNETELKAKIGALASVLANSQKELPQIKYIDLRYKEPLIKLEKR